MQELLLLALQVLMPVFSDIKHWKISTSETFAKLQKIVFMSKYIFFGYYSNYIFSHGGVYLNPLKMLRLVSIQRKEFI